jgi:hypothetical protein
MTIRAVGLVAFAITVIGCAHVSLPSPTISADHPTTIQLSTYAGRLRSVSVTVGNATHPLIFDTGGGETMISPDLASGIGCKPYGRAIGFRMGGEQVAFEYCDGVLLRLGDVSIAHDRVGVFDLKSILPRDAPPADGVVSLQSFRGQPVTIDLASGRITLETARSLAARTPRMRPLMMRVATGPTGAETTVYIAARVGGQRVWFLLDSGTGDPALVSAYVARTAGLQSGTGNMQIDFDGLGPVQLPVATRQMIYDGVLGVGFIQDWVFTFDLKAGRAWAAPAPRRISSTR